MALGFVSEHVPVEFQVQTTTLVKFLTTLPPYPRKWVIHSSGNNSTP